MVNIVWWSSPSQLQPECEALNLIYQPQPQPQPQPHLSTSKQINPSWASNTTMSKKRRIQVSSPEDVQRLKGWEQKIKIAHPKKRARKKMEEADLVRQRFSRDKWWVLWGELSLLIWLLPEGPIFPPYSAVSRPGQNWKMYKTQVRRINLHTTALHSSLVQHFINIFSFSSHPT